MPVIKHLDGVFHVYIDAAADLELAVRIADNAKTQRGGTCNTMETLLVHAGIAAACCPRSPRSTHPAKAVELRGDEKARALVPAMKVATEDDLYAEYLAPILALPSIRSTSRSRISRSTDRSTPTRS